MKTPEGKIACPACWNNSAVMRSIGNKRHFTLCDTCYDEARNNLEYFKRLHAMKRLEDERHYDLSGLD